MDGIFLVNKPVGPTSTAITNRIRWLLKQSLGKKNIKVGHGGTLDPFACGVLPVAVGQATRLLTPLLNAPKTYAFTLQFGTATSTGDTQGISTQIHTHRPTQAHIVSIIPQFTGLIWQTPPAFSALKVGGQRAYHLARQGQAVTLAPRQVTVHSLTLMCAQPNEAQFTARVSKGTYIRTLGQDIALALGTVGHLTSLQRQQHGPFILSQCVDYQMLDNLIQTGHAAQHLIPITRLNALLGTGA